MIVYWLSTQLFARFWWFFGFLFIIVIWVWLLTWKVSEWTKFIHTMSVCTSLSFSASSLHKHRTKCCFVILFRFRSNSLPLCTLTSWSCCHANICEWYKQRQNYMGFHNCKWLKCYCHQSRWTKARFSHKNSTKSLIWFVNSNLSIWVRINKLSEIANPVIKLKYYMWY